MKAIVLLFLLLTTVASLKSFAQQPYDIIFDLDRTLFDSTTEEMRKAVPENTFRIHNELYRYSDFALEVLIYLHQSGYRISFYSGGEESRNKEALELTYNEIQRRTQRKDFKPYKILSFNDLKKVSDDDTKPFVERYKKPLAPHFDTKTAILVDDRKEFAFPGEEGNLLWLGKTYNDRPRYQLAHFEDPNKNQWSAPNYEEWQRDRRKLIYAISEITGKPLQLVTSIISNMKTEKLIYCRMLF